MSSSKELYIFIIYPKNKDIQNNEITFTDKKALIQNIYTEKDEKYKKDNIIVLKYTMKNNSKKPPPKKEDTKEKKGNKKEQVKIEFIADKEKKIKYIIEFDLGDKIFIYEPKLTNSGGFYGTKKVIPQKTLSYSEKMNIFYSALTKEAENEGVLSSLYKDSIILYGKNPTFEFLVNLFVKVYNNIDICKMLLKEFKNSLKKESQKSEIYIENLLKFKDTFQDICDKSENKIKENQDIIIDYYGLILCYLNNYNFPKFSEIVNHLYAQDSTILFQILLTYKSYFKKDIKVDEKILDEFIGYAAGKTYIDLTENALFYLKNLKLFLKIINKNKEKLIDIENFKSIQSTNSLENKMAQKDINEIIDLVEDIIDFSIEKKQLLIAFVDNFWEKLINNCDSSTQENILLLSRLREIFIKYFTLLADLNKKDKIFKNASEFEKKDKFDITLHKNIKEHLKKEQNIQNIDIINLIMLKDPIYSTDKNIGKRDAKMLLDKIDFEKIDQEFIESYKQFNFEKVFKKDIVNYLTTLFRKVKNWDNFYTIFHLINDENLEPKNISDLVTLLDTTYKKLISDKKINESNLPDEELGKIIETLSEIIVFMSDNKADFFPKIKELNKEIQNKIYLELYTKYNEEKHKDIIEKIKDYYIKNLKIENLNKFIIFIEKLNYEDHKDIDDIIYNKYKINENDFYAATSKKINIILLCKLNEKNLLKEEDKYYEDSIKILEILYEEIENKKIKINQLKSFFNCEEVFIKEKFNLFLLLKEKHIDVNELYEKLKNVYDEINSKLKDLNYIVSNLEKYHFTFYKKDIEKIKSDITTIESGNWQDYEDRKTSLNIFNELKKEADQINEVKQLNLFNILYRNTKGADQKKHFEKALEKLEKISEILKSNDEENKKILEEVKKNNRQIEEEIKKYFAQKKRNADNDLSLLVNYDSYVKDIKSIFYFFDNLHNDENWNQILLPKYKEISKENIEQYLKELKEKGIYDYEHEKSQKSYYILFFNYLYKKQQALDFLNQLPDNLNLLYEKLDPNNGTIKAKDIDDTISCVEFFKEIKKFEKHEDTFKFIQEKFKGNIKLIESFKNFSDVYVSIIDLNQNFDDFALNLYEEVKNIVKKTEIIFYQYYEEIFLSESNKDIQNRIKTINDLLLLKNKINVKRKNIVEGSENEKKLIKKNNTLLFFKEIINNIESIYEHITVLRTKGSILPIRIKVEIEDEEKDKDEEKINIKIRYFLNDKKDKEVEKDFNYIDKFLSNAKNDYIKQLELFYKINDYMRFFYGRQIVSIVDHLNGYKEIFPFLRYILNATGDKTINEGSKVNVHSVQDFINNYDIYHEETFKNISNYVLDLFKCNNLSLEKHYEKMEIKKNNNENKLKGIYIYESQSESMEEDILQIFLDKIGRLPIAQNILITNKETSYEEMQAFLNRAILCRYNALFVIEINESFSEYQQRYLNRFIDKLLSFKNESYTKLYKKAANNKNPSEYMDSCLVFVCNEKTKSALNYIKKAITTPLFRLKRLHRLNTSIFNIDNNLNVSINDNANTANTSINSLNKSMNISREELSENIHVIKSEICGLGKTEKIKKEIKEKGKEYVHFPVGGNITRNILYKKLKSILDKIKNIKALEEKDVAIHLDLYDNNEASILNEFLFSFLITKFYSNSENIIYIPKYIEIFIEIPNCFEDFLSKYTILKSFEIENIELDKKPELDLPDDKLLHFKNMLNKNNNKEISEYINENFEISKYSYHQITIFINLFIGQYSKTNDKRTFWSGWTNVTDKVIESFKNCTKYFTSGAFANLLVNKDLLKEINGKNDDYIKVLGKTYDNDLENQDFQYPLIFRNPKIDKTSYFYILSIKKDFIGFVDFDGKKEVKSDEYKLNSSTYFLKILKKILELETPIETLKKIIDKDEYVITNDNFRKMVLIIYRIVANIPVILMGETGCGKTSLIRKLNQLLNNGEENLEFINIHPGITDDFLKKKMSEINEKAKGLKENLWVFFDELNTCDSFALLTEIFINRSFEGEKLSSNIRIIGACNPYRKREKGKIKCGLSHPDDKNDDYVYLVNLLPQSLMYYIFNFGSLNNDDESKYIKSIIAKNFDRDEEDLKEQTKKIISECHQFLKKKFDPSVVSLREIARFSRCLKFFIDYYKKKNEYENKKIKESKTIEGNKKIEGNQKLEKIKSIIISIYICYYIRLTEKQARQDFDKSLMNELVNLVNINTKKNEKEKVEVGLLSKIYNQEFLDDIKRRNKISQFEQFSKLLEIEEEFLLDKVELGKGIGNSRSLRENLFLLFVSLGTNIPLIIIGKPGSGKSLSSHLIYKSMKGKYSTNDFFKSYPSIIQSYFQGANSTLPEDVENIFSIAESRLKSFKKASKQDIPISMLLFDELGLAERSKYNPLKVLHKKLDDYFTEHKNINSNTNDDQIVDFVGITNWNLDAAKLNRALSLSVPDLDEDIEDAQETASSIANSFNVNFAEKKNNNSNNANTNEINKDNNIEIFGDLLPKVYYYYKKALKNLKKLTVKKQYINIHQDKKGKILGEIETENQFKEMYSNEKRIKIDFHGNRDFFYLIKGVARELNETNEIENGESVAKVIEKYIERNFGGMEIEIDIDENDIPETDNYLKNIVELKAKKLTSVTFFKCIYNTFVDKQVDKNENYKNYKIKKIENYEAIKCINDNVKDEYSRYLLLGIKPSVAILINQYIEKKMSMIKNVFLYEGSPFINDEGMEYQYRMINEIQEHAKNENGDILFLQNLNSIYPFLYDLFNMNYIIKDGKAYARICHGNYSDQLALINKLFRIVIMVNKKYIDKMESPFLNRFEKIIISIRELLNPFQKKISSDLLSNECDFKSKLEKQENKLNYNMKDLLIGCKEEDIQGLVYDYSKDDEKSEEAVKSYVIKKIVKLLPQDIIVNLPDDDRIKIEYFKNKKYNNIKEYINKKDDIYKISIIYTFTNITDNIPVLDDYGESILISEIKSEKDLKKRIFIINSNYQKSPKPKRYIFLRFTQSNSQYLNFVVPFLKANFQEHIYFICIIHIKRNFDEKDKKDKMPKKDKLKKIDNVPNLYNTVEQLFIDNLKNLKEDDESTKINLEKILRNSVTDLLDYIDLPKEFEKALQIFINKHLSNNTNLLKGEDDNINQENYLTHLENYFKNDQKLMNNIIHKAKDLINFNGSVLIKKIYEKKCINKNSIDIISIILDYIREKLISQYFMDILENLEDNNFITSLLVLSNKNKEIEILNQEIIEEIEDAYISQLNYEEKNNYDLKFDLNYFLPGFYNIIRELSNIISKNYSDNFMSNEKKLRLFLKGNKEDALSNFEDNEMELINELYNELQNEKNKKIFNIMNSIKVPDDLFFNDYITFYLDKYYYNKNIKINNNIKYSCVLSFGYINHKIIKLLLELRFKKAESKEEDNDDYENKDDNFKSLLKKICWLESNSNYIIDILEIYSELKGNFEKEEKLFEIIDENIKNLNIKYITHEDKNPKITTLVNECYYIILASIIYSVFPPNIDFQNKKSSLQLNYYIDSLKTSSKIIGDLNSNLYIFLNEMYIIDEFIIIFETLEINNKIDLNLLNKISENLRDNSAIIQKYEENFSEELIEKYKELYKLITEKLAYTDKNYYNLLKNIFFKEIKKIKDVDYRMAIFADLIKENEVIKSCNDIFQILLKELIKPSKVNFLKTIQNLLDDQSEIILLIESILCNKKENNYFTLSETLLYFFEKNSFIYLNKILNEYIVTKDKKKEKEKYTLDEENEPLKVFKNCIKNLDEYNDKNKNKNKNKNITKLFCIGFIKTFCYKFIQFMGKNEKDKIKNPKKIIDEINSSKIVSKIITLYIYKIIYNINDKDSYIFSIDEFIDKYKLNLYKHFEEFKIMDYDNELFNQINYDKEYQDMYDVIEKYKFKQFKNITLDEFKSEGIDKFYFASSNLILSNLIKKGFEKSETYINFYNNVCKSLFKSPTILKALKLFYDPTKYEKIKNQYEINNDILKIIIYSYRYCLNEIISGSENSIYGLFYDKNRIKDINKYYYPGNDIKDNPTYDVYIKILNHFKEKPKQACFVCMCKDGYYYSTRDEEPNEKDIDQNCPFCEEPMGSIKEKRRTIRVKRNNYFRILTQDEYDYKKKRGFHEYDYITIDNFKEKYIDTNLQEEKGISKNDENHLKKDNKIVRDLTQVSYRLLNFILYSHLFFAKLITEDKEYDNYLPDKMKWGQLINELWQLLKIELNNKGINNIELFMNYIFNDLFNKLNENKNIKEYQAFKKLEKVLHNLIIDKISLFLKEYKKDNPVNENIDKSDERFIYYLLKEKYTDIEFDEYPFYQNFFYSDYIDENYLLELLKLKNKEKYPVLLKSLDHSPKKEVYSLKKLEIFNGVLNLISEEYLCKISREDAEKNIIKEDEIYKENSEIIDNFIKFYNDLKKKNEKKKILKLDIESKLSNFFVDDNTDIGKSYKEIFKEFIKKQNEELEPLLKIKIDNEVFDKNCRKTINVQNISENEIFTLKLPNNFSFTDIAFNHSYRKVVIDNDYKSYNKFIIDLDSIEETMTELLLKNKKLLNDNITNFIYKNEDLVFESSDVITKFNNNSKFEMKQIDLDDKVILYEFYEEHHEDINLLVGIINDFIQLIIFLNNNKDNNKISDKISGTKEISEVFKVLNGVNMSSEFKGIFEDKNTLTINKTTNLLMYYIRLIFDKVIKDEFIEFQIKLENIEKTRKDKIKNHFNKKLLIGRKEFRNAIRLLVSLFLYKEKEKEQKIKNNSNNIVNYLNIKDVWIDILTNKNEFKEELKEIKKLKIQINQILAIYELLTDNKEEEEKYYDDVIKESEKRKNEREGGDQDEEKNEEGGEEEEANNEEEEKEEEEANNEEDEQPQEEEDDDGNRD